MIRSNLRVVMAQRAINQAKLNERSGVSLPTIGKLFRNETKQVDLDVLNKLCRTLECQPGDILKMEDDE